MTTSHSRRCWNTIYMYDVDLTWVWSGWGVQNHNLQHITSKKQIESPTTTTETVRPIIHQVGVASSWPLSTVEAAETLYMYDEDLLWVWSGWGAPIISYSTLQVRNPYYCYHWDCDPKHIISGWDCCILMTTSHSRRCWNTIYIYISPQKKPGHSLGIRTYGSGMAQSSKFIAKSYLRMPQLWLTRYCGLGSMTWLCLKKAWWLEVCLAFLYALGMTWWISSMPRVQLGVCLWYD